MTAQELIKELSKFDSDTPVIMCIDGEANPFVRAVFNDRPYIVLTNVASEDPDDDSV